MKTYYRNTYGATASIRVNRDGSATLKVCDANGRPCFGKCYSNRTAARRALGKLGDCWKERRPSA